MLYPQAQGNRFQTVAAARIISSMKAYPFDYGATSGLSVT